MTGAGYYKLFLGKGTIHLNTAYRLKEATALKKRNTKIATATHKGTHSINKDIL